MRYVYTTFIDTFKDNYSDSGSNSKKNSLLNLINWIVAPWVYLSILSPFWYAYSFEIYKLGIPFWKKNKKKCLEVDISAS